MAGMLDRAKHEFGHYVSARNLGFMPGDVSVEIDGNKGGSVSIDTFRPIKSIDEMASFCEDRIKVLYAGVQSEALTAGRVDNKATLDLVADTGQGDHMMVQQLCNILRNIRYSDLPVGVGASRMQDDERRLWNETKELVEANARLICDLAQELYDRRAVHGMLAEFSEAELNEHPLLKMPSSSSGSQALEISSGM